MEHHLPAFLGTSIIVALSIMVIAFLLRSSEARYWRTFVLLGYAIHLVTNLAVGYQGPRGNDARWYDEYAVQRLASWLGTQQEPPPVFEDREFFISTVTASYWAFGPSVLPMLALNALAIALLAMVGASITRELGGPLSAQRMCLLAMFSMPVLVVWSKDLLREPYMFLFTMTACYGVLRGVRGRPWIVWTVVPLLLLYGFRAESAIILALGLLPAGLIGVLKVPRVIVAVLAVVSLTYLFGLRHIESFLPSEEVRLASRAEISSGNTGLESSSAALIEPEIFIRVILGPFPWEWAGSVAPLLVDAIFVWVILLYTAAWVRSEPSPAVGALIIPALAILIATSFAAYNYGLLVRIRAQGYVLLIPVAAAGWQMLHDRRKGSSGSNSNTTAAGLS